MLVEVPGVVDVDTHPDKKKGSNGSAWRTKVRLRDQESLEAVLAQVRAVGTLEVEVEARLTGPPTPSAPHLVARLPGAVVEEERDGRRGATGDRSGVGELVRGRPPVGAVRLAAGQRSGALARRRPTGPGFWAITRYADIRTISRQPKLFSSYARGVMMAEADEVGLAAQRQMMLSMDPPQHDRFKLLVEPRLHADATPQLLRDRIEELAREIVDDVIERGECDLVHDVAGRLPSGLIAELMGIPRADGERLYELTEIMHTTDDAVAPPERRGRRRARCSAYAGEVAAAQAAPSRATTSPRRSCRPRSTASG